jgi:hemin uptake protein HemP
MPSAVKTGPQRALEDEQALPAAEQLSAGKSGWNSEQLFGRAQEVGIRHEGHLYRLRRTRLGKIILTK